MEKKTETPVSNIKKHFDNIIGALDIAQKKGIYTLGQSAYIFSSLQRINEFLDAKAIAPTSTTPTPSVPTPGPFETISTGSNVLTHVEEKETIQI